MAGSEWQPCPGVGPAGLVHSETPGAGIDGAALLYAAFERGCEGSGCSANLIYSPRLAAASEAGGCHPLMHRQRRSLVQTRAVKVHRRVYRSSAHHVRCLLCVGTCMEMSNRMVREHWAALLETVMKRPLSMTPAVIKGAALCLSGQGGCSEQPERPDLSNG